MKVRTRAVLLVGVLGLLTVFGVDTTGSAQAAVITSDDPVTTPGDIVTYTDANGQQHTIKLPAPPKTTYTNPTYNTGTSPVILPRQTTGLQHDCSEYHAVGNTPITLTAVCAAILAGGMAGDALGFLGDFIQAPLGWLFPGAPVIPGQQNPNVPFCPPGRCIAGWYDDFNKLWYDDPSESIGLVPGSVSVTVNQATSVITVEYRARFHMRLGTSDATQVNLGTFQGELMCSDGVQIAPHTFSSPTRSLTYMQTDWDRYGVADFEKKTPWTFNLTSAERTKYNTCVTAGKHVSFNLKHGYTTGTPAQPVKEIGVWFKLDGAPTEGTLTSKVTCTKADGSSVVVENSRTGDFRPGERTAIPDAQCPPDSIVTEKQVDYNGAPVIPPTATTPVPGIQEALENMDCYTGKKVCKLELRQSDGVSCGPGAVYCPSWASDPNADTRYQCFYNNKAVTLNTCSGFRAPTVGVLPNTDEDGNPIPYTAPVPDDLTEIPEEEVPRIGDGGESDTPEGKQCFPTGWNVLNPVEWVMKPVGCALDAAFVPSETVIQGHLDRAVDAWSETAPYQLMDAVTGWQFTPPPAGCNGIPVNVFFIPTEMHVMSACEGDFLAPVADWARIFGTIGFIAFGVIGVTRNIARIFGFPGLGGDSA